MVDTAILITDHPMIYRFARSASFVYAGQQVDVFIQREKNEQELTTLPHTVYNKMVSLVFSMNRPARGFRTSGRKILQPAFGKPAPLTASDTVRTALLKTLRASLQHILANLDLTHQETRPETVHQLRTAVRRIRLLLSVFRKEIDHRERIFLSGELKWFQQQLGPAREWDVSVGEILNPLAERKQSRKGIARLRALANQHRTSAHNHSSKTLHSRRLKNLLQRLERLLELLTRDESQGEPAAAQLPQSWNKQQKQSMQSILKLARKALQTQHIRAQTLGTNVRHLNDNELHKLRIQLRKLRYTTELFDCIWHRKKSRERADRYLACLKKLQTALGSAHDSTVATRQVESIRAEAGPKIERDFNEVLARIAVRHESFRKQLHKLWKQFTRIRKYWNDK